MSLSYPQTADDYLAALTSLRAAEDGADPPADPGLLAERLFACLTLETLWWDALRLDQSHAYEYDSDQRSLGESENVESAIFVLELTLGFFAEDPVRTFPELATLSDMLAQLGGDSELKSGIGDKVTVDGLAGTCIAAAATDGTGYVSFTGSGTVSARLYAYQDWNVILRSIIVQQIQCDSDPTKYVLRVKDPWWGDRIQPSTWTEPPFSENFDLGDILLVRYSESGVRTNSQGVNFVYDLWTEDDGVLRGLWPHESGINLDWPAGCQTHTCEYVGEDGIAHILIPKYGIFQGKDTKVCDSDPTPSKTRYVKTWYACAKQRWVEVTDAAPASIDITNVGYAHFTGVGPLDLSISWNGHTFTDCAIHRDPGAPLDWTTGGIVPGSYIALCSYGYTASHTLQAFTVTEGQTTQVALTPCVVNDPPGASPIEIYDAFCSRQLVRSDSFTSRGAPVGPPYWGGDDAWGGDVMTGIMAAHPDGWIDGAPVACNSIWWDSYWGPVPVGTFAHPIQAAGGRILINTYLWRGRVDSWNHAELPSDDSVVTLRAIDSYGCPANVSHNQTVPYDPATDASPYQGWNCQTCGTPLVKRVDGSIYNPIGLHVTPMGALLSEQIPSAGWVSTSWSEIVPGTWGLNVDWSTLSYIWYKTVVRGTSPATVPSFVPVSGNGDAIYMQRGGGFPAFDDYSGGDAGTPVPFDFLHLTMGSKVEGNIARHANTAIPTDMHEAIRKGFEHGKHLGFYTEQRFVAPSLQTSTLTAAGSIGDTELAVADASAFPAAPALAWVDRAAYCYTSKTGTVLTLRNPLPQAHSIDSIVGASAGGTGYGYTCFTEMQCPYDWSKLETDERMAADGLPRGYCPLCKEAGILTDGRTYHLSPPMG